MKSSLKYSHFKITIIAFFFIGSFSCFAQSSFGVKAGFGYSGEFSNSRYGENNNSTIPSVGFQLGLTGELRLSQDINLATELLVSEKGTISNFHDLDHTFSRGEFPVLLDIPLHLKYHTPGNTKWFFLLGPYISFGLGGKRITIENYYDPGVYTKEIEPLFENEFMDPVDLGFNLGTGIEFNRYKFELRYQISALGCGCGSDPKLNVFSLTMGYNFFVRSKK